MEAVRKKVNEVLEKEFENWLEDAQNNGWNEKEAENLLENELNDFLDHKNRYKKETTDILDILDLFYPKEKEDSSRGDKFDEEWHSNQI